MSKRQTPHRHTIPDAMSMAESTISDLAESCREQYDNAQGTAFESTERVEMAGEWADSLEELTSDWPDTPDMLDAVFVEFFQNELRGRESLGSPLECWHHSGDVPCSSRGATGHRV